MLSPALIAFIAAISAATWIYTLTMRRTGGNTQNSLAVGAIAGVAVFIVVLTIVWTIDSMVGGDKSFL